MTSFEFEYKAIDRNGQVVTGRKHSSDEFSLQKELKSEGLSLIHAEVVQKISLKTLFVRFSSMRSVSTHEKIIFNRNLGAMLEAGLPMSRALSIIERQSKNSGLKNVIKEIEDKVKKGSALSVAMKDFPAIFSSLVISMVQSGEESGNLVDALNVVADQMEKQYLLNKKIKGALVYPGVIITAMVAIGIFMLVYIVPTLTGTFAELNVELPASTQFVIHLSNFIRTNFVLALGIVFAAIASIWMLSKNTKGLRAIHWLFLHIPMVSELVKEINSARTARTLASLLSAGVPYVRSLQIVKEVVQNSYYKDVIAKAEKTIQLGTPISKVFSEAENLYPVFVSEMIAVGEETGELGPMLLKVAAFYEDEVDQKTKNLSTIVEPFLMVIVGAAVGFFAISMISPMYSLVNEI